MAVSIPTIGRVALRALLFMAAALYSPSLRLSAEEFAPIELNAGTASYDHHPSRSEDPSGGAWLAWHAYRNSRDWIVARYMDADGKLGELRKVNRLGTALGPPTIVAESPQRARLLWTAKLDGRWSVMLSEWKGQNWSIPKRLSAPDRDAIYPTAVQVDVGRIQVAWSEHAGERFRIVGCTVDQNGSSPLMEISSVGRQEGQQAYRPMLAVHKDQVWAFWDQYDAGNFSVRGRCISPMKNEEEQVSPPGQYCLTPTAKSHSTGLHVAWLRKVDVIGRPGVVSQWHTLHAARRRSGKWELIRDEEGNDQGAELTQGLMAQIAPKPIATGGYLGARVRPMLQVIDEPKRGGQVWLLWERKTDHRGSTPRVTGDLLGRPIVDGRWQTPRLLHQGRVDYHVVHASDRNHNPDKAPSITVLASKLPKRSIRIYEQIRVEMKNSRPFQQDRWEGWHPVELPIRSEQAPRHKIRLDGHTLQLFWADLHCHNNLSADAEGEADELNHYAQDRAGLDVAAFTNNDFYNVPLTQYEYEVGNLFASKLSQRGRFLSLPGYEWTSRIPGLRSAALGDSGNWLPPYQNRSYANHRSVLYPNSRGPLVHFTEVGNDINRLNQAVAKAGGITLSQHPTFKLSGHPVEVGLELTSGWSNYIDRNPTLFHRSLEVGRRDPSKRMGFVANGDTHRRAPGLSGALTGIYARELSAEGILDALRQRRCFATSGSRIAIESRANGEFMGRESKAADGSVKFELRVRGSRPIKSAVLIRNGEPITQIDGDGNRDLRVEFVDRNPPTGVHYYYWRIAQNSAAPALPGNLMAAHGHLAWSSPHWVVVE